MAGTEEILALCRLMGAGEEQDELLLPLIDAAAAGLERRLKPGISPQDCGAAFPLAAAMTAMDGLERAAGLDAVTSFSAGELSIQTGGRQSAGTLAQQADRLLAPWLGENGFAFRGVEG